MAMRLIVTLLFIVTLLLICPAAANAQAAGFDGFLWAVVLGVVVLGLIVWYFVDYDYGADEAGEMFFTLTGYDLPSQSTGLNPMSPQTDAPLDFNLNCMLTDKTEDNFWLSTGITLNFTPGRDIFPADEIAYGPNLEFGYIAEDFVTKLNFYLLTEQRSRASLEFVYRY